LERHTEGDRRSVSRPKNRRKARAVIFSHQFGWEVRLLVGSEEELVSSQVSRTQDELVTTGAQGKSAMLEKGWL
jgi:hypothetical protein